MNHIDLTYTLSDSLLSAQSESPQPRLEGLLNSPIFVILMATLLIASPQQEQQTPQNLECRDMKTTGSTLGPNETAVLGKACKPAASTSAIASSPTLPAPTPPKSAGTVATPSSEVTPPVANGEIPKGFLLEDGTPVHIVLDENVSSADAVTGQTVEFEVADEVIVNGYIVIPRGSTAWATVTDAEHKRRMGRAGHVNMNIDKVRLADGEKVLLRAVKQSQGGSNTGKMVGAMAVTALFTFGGSALFLLVHGKDTIIPKGTPVTAFIQGNVTLDQSKFHRQPVLQ